MAQRVVIGSAEQVRPGQRTLVETAGREVVVFNVDGRWHAVQNKCPHAGAPLMTSGSIRGSDLVCDWHDVCFDLKSGESDSGFELCVFPAGVDADGRLFVEIPG